MEINIYIIIALVLGVLIGSFIGWLIAKSKMAADFHAEKEKATEKYNQLENEFIVYKATSSEQLSHAQEKINSYYNELISLKDSMLMDKKEYDELNTKLAGISANYDAARLTII